MIEQKLKNEEEEQHVQSRINRLNDMRGTAKAKDSSSGGTSTSGGGGGGGGTGLKNTWKKLKGKKKKQRNLTAPEISTQDIKAAMTDDARTTALTSVREDGSDKKGKGIFGKKQPKESPKKSASPAVLGETVFKNVQVDSPDVDPLSQRSDRTLSQPAEHTGSDADVISPSDAKSKSSMSDVIILEPLSLSQTSGKHSTVSLSQSDAFVGNEDQFSSQSSAEVPISNALLDTEHNADNDSVIWDNREAVKEEENIDEGGYNSLGSYLHGSSVLYNRDYGSKQHKLNLERVREFLESSSEMEPKDMSMLQDWDGWMVASKEIR